MSKTRNRLVMEALSDGLPKSAAELQVIINADYEQTYDAVSSLRQNKDLISLPKVKGFPKQYVLTDKGIARLQVPDRPFPSAIDPEVKKQRRAAIARNYRQKHPERVRVWRKNEREAAKQRGYKSPRKASAQVDKEVEEWVAGALVKNPDEVVASAKSNMCDLARAWANIGA